MRNFSLIILSLVLVMGFAFSCKKWEDPAPKDDPRLTRPYCNDPSAVNYNWDFPGKPDNTVCFFPADLFAGNYILFDTIYSLKEDLYLSADSIPITITKISQTQISVSGMCPSGVLLLTAGATYNASVDTTVGDSLTRYPGQFFCRTVDTIVGSFIRDKFDSSIMYIELLVRSDTGTTSHIGRAIKK